MVKVRWSATVTLPTLLITLPPAIGQGQGHWGIQSQPLVPARGAACRLIRKSLFARRARHLAQARVSNFTSIG